MEFSSSIRQDNAAVRTTLGHKRVRVMSSRLAAQRRAHEAAAYWAAQAELEAANRVWAEEQRAKDDVSAPTSHIDHSPRAAKSSTESQPPSSLGMPPRQRVMTSVERDAEALRQWREAFELETRHAKLCASRRAMEEETERLAEQAVREQVALELEE